MLRFLARRAFFGLLVLWIVSVAVFVLFFVTPHDPAKTIAGRLATPQTVALVNHRLGLDRPLLAQYGGFVWRLLHGDLGYSYYSSAPVRELLFSRLPVTASLALGAAVLWLLVGVGAGVVAARRPRSLVDVGSTLLVLTGLSMPTFLVGLLLIYFLFFRLHLAGVDLFPASGYVPLTQDPAEWARHLLLPWATLALGTLLGGVIVTEQIFGLPGLGQLAWQSVTTQDLPVIIGTVLVASAFIVVANLLVDLGYALLDPRVRPS